MIAFKGGGISEGIFTKAEFTPVSTFFYEHIFLRWEILIIKKLEIEKTKTTFIISVLKDVYYLGGLSVFEIQLFY